MSARRRACQHLRHRITECCQVHLASRTPDRSTALRAVASRVGEAVSGPLGNQSSLELSEGSGHLEKETSVRRTGVDGHIVDEESHLVGFELTKKMGMLVRPFPRADVPMAFSCVSNSVAIATTNEGGGAVRGNVEKRIELI